MADAEYTTITVAEYLRLSARDDELSALEAYGVDNWEGYSDALSDTEGLMSDE